MGLVHTNRLIRGKLFNRFSIPVGERAEKIRPLCKVFNEEISSIACMMLIISIFLSTSTIRGRLLRIEIDDLNIVLYIVLYILSILLHEFGHLAAAVSYKHKTGRIEVGVLFFIFIPIAAYVKEESKKDTVKNENLQLVMAGLEVNLLLAGVFYIAAVFCETQANTFLIAALTNLAFIIGNLIPMEILRTDGTLALNTLFECDSIFDLARKWLGNRRRRKKLLHNGLPGIACMTLLTFVYIARFLYFIFVIGFNIYAIFFI